MLTIFSGRRRGHPCATATSNGSLPAQFMAGPRRRLRPHHQPNRSPLSRPRRETGKGGCGHGEVKAAEVQAAFLERCKAERESFTPYIHVDGEKTVPNGITIFGISGGHQRWTTMEIPKTILALPLGEQLVKLPKSTVLSSLFRSRFAGGVVRFNCCKRLGWSCAQVRAEIVCFVFGA